MEAVLRRPLPMRGIELPTFCHGVAGLLYIVLRFAHDTGSPTMKAGAVALIEQIIGLHEPESLLGFRSIEYAGKRVDQPGLLDGAPGVALVLLAAACSVEPQMGSYFPAIVGYNGKNQQKGHSQTCSALRGRQSA